MMMMIMLLLLMLVGDDKMCGYYSPKRCRRHRRRSIDSLAHGYASYVNSVCVYECV
jgi:hypothetical protein